MSIQQFLTMKDLMNYHYCPRIVYFESVLKVPQATTVKELKGRELHFTFTKTSRRNKIVKDFPKFFKKYGLFLESKDLNFRTVIDCVIINKDKNEAFPIEYKYSNKPKKLYNSQKIQLFAECLLIKEKFGYFTPSAFIKFEKSGDLVRIEITDADLIRVEDTIKNIDKIISTEVMPEPTPYRKKCKVCCYMKLCRRI